MQFAKLLSARRIPIFAFSMFIRQFAELLPVGQIISTHKDMMRHEQKKK